MKFLQIKERGPNFWGQPISQNGWIIWSPLLYFDFKSFLDPNSSPFISFQCSLYDSGVLLSEFSNLYKLKRGEFNLWREPIFQNVWIIWSPLLYLNLKNPMETNSSSFIRFQSILHESEIFFWESWNFYKLKSWDLISGANQFCRMSELFGAPFCILILEVLWTKKWLPKILVGELKKWKWFTIQIICSEMHSTACANTHHDASTLEVDDMISNIKILTY